MARGILTTQQQRIIESEVQGGELNHPGPARQAMAGKGSRYGTLGDIVQLREAGRKKTNKVEFGGVSSTGRTMGHAGRRRRWRWIAARHRGEGVSPGEMFHMVGSRLITQRRVLSNDLFCYLILRDGRCEGSTGSAGSTGSTRPQLQALATVYVGWTQVPGLIMWERGGGRDISPRERRQTPAANKTNKSRRASRTGLTGGEERRRRRRGIGRRLGGVRERTSCV